MEKLQLIFSVVLADLWTSVVASASPSFSISLLLMLLISWSRLDAYRYIQKSFLPNFV
jgi:hypothetical protein